jgi:hypothetical protein
MVAYPNYAPVGPHASWGYVKTRPFIVRVNAPFAFSAAAVEIFATDEMQTWRVLIGRINLFIKEGSLQSTSLQVTAAVSNLESGRVRLDHPWLNQPGPVAFVSGVYNGVYNPHALGLEYDWNTGHSYVVNEDGTSIPVGARFNVKIESGATYLYSSNTTDYTMIIDNPIANNNPRAVMIVTPFHDSLNYPNRNPHNIGVWYNGSRWSIFNQDFASLGVTQFHVRIIGQQQPSPAPQLMIHTATSPSGNYTEITNQNWTASDKLIFTQNFSPFGIYNNRPTGLWWTGSKWAIFNENWANMPTNAGFNVWRPADAF